jgi:pyruvate dehydrogenase E2 component (dihydrolipoamide acetyltransferase)
MAVEIRMPHLSQTTDEVRFIRWLVQEGSKVNKGDPICEVETDKVTTVVESFEDGTVLKLLALPDTVVYAGTIIAIIGEPGEKFKLPEQGLPEGITKEGVDRTSVQFEARGISEKELKTPEQGFEAKGVSYMLGKGEPSKGEAEGDILGKSFSERSILGRPEGLEFYGDATVSGVREEREIKATPLVINIAKKKGIDLRKVRGSGPRGLITKQDLEDYEASIEKVSAEKVPPEKVFLEDVATGKVYPGGRAEGLTEYEKAEVPQELYQPLVQEPGIKEIKLTRNQLATGRNLLKSKTTIPHYYIKTDVFTDGVLRWRLRYTGKDGGKASVYSFLIYAAARALRQHPRLNSYIKDDRLILFDRVNVGFAVSRGEELYVPVVRDADSKSIEEIDREVKWLIAKIQNNRIEQADISGGTFTVTNLGPYQVDEFYAIINPPQAGILAVGRMRKTLFIDDSGAMSIKTACTVTGSFDHRIVNGAAAAAFLDHFKKIIEEIQ